MPRRFRHALWIFGIATATTAGAADSAPLNYQWYFDGTNTAAFAVTNVSPAQTHTNASATDSSTNPTLSQADLDLQQGRRLFATHCSMCHGPNGEGGKGPTLAQPTLPRASDDNALISIISGGIQGTEMPSAHLAHPETELVAKYVRSLGSQPREPLPGDPARGAELYAKKGACAQCHLIHGQGGVFGPDLSDIGRRRSAAYLRRSLVDPSADVPQSYSAWRYDVSLPENFLYVRLTPRDGQEYAGVRVNEDTFSIQIRQANGVVYSFFKDELTELHKDFGKSPMPSYANALTKNEIDDLVAYLASLRLEK